jgi:DNA repair protein RadC
MNTGDAGKYAVTLYIGENREVFHLICLDAQNRVNMPARICEGTINEASVYPRLVVENALRYNANSVILSHNHPGGSMKPSPADLEMTRKLKTVLESISIKVIDHIVVAGCAYISLAEQGLMP